MATSKDDIKSQYPLPAYNYRVTILEGSALGIGAGAINVISCSQVTGLNMEIETEIYKHGFSFLTGFSIIPGQRKEVRLTIKKGVTQQSSYFSNWIKKVYPHIQPLPLSLNRKRDILIDLCDESGEPVVRWIALKAIPVKLEAPSFDVNTNEVAFEQMEFIAHELKVEYINES